MCVNREVHPCKQTVLLVANATRVSRNEVRSPGSRDDGALCRLVAAIL